MRRQPQKVAVEPVDWVAVLCDSLSEEQRAALRVRGYFEVAHPFPVAPAVRVYPTGDVAGHCVRLRPTASNGAGAGGRPNPWVAYQIALWVEARPDLFFAVADENFHTEGETVRDRRGREWVVTGYDEGLVRRILRR